MKAGKALPPIEQAKHWYDRAAVAGSKPAMQRNSYLEIKERGFNQATDSAWLKGVKTDAAAHQGEAMLLLGQLYSEGLGVNKDLMRSLELLQQVQTLGIANVEDQILLTLNMLDADKKDELKDQSSANVNKKKVNDAETKKRIHDEKIRKYEKVMQQLRNEQQKIDEQQAWASGEDSAVVGEDEI